MHARHVHAAWSLAKDDAEGAWSTSGKADNIWADANTCAAALLRTCGGPYRGAHWLPGRPRWCCASSDCPTLTASCAQLNGLEQACSAASTPWQARCKPCVP